jgi:Ribonuclease toxin, BrnT, of type II toxin-antitoxin system
MLVRGPADERCRESPGYPGRLALDYTDPSKYKLGGPERHRLTGYGTQTILAYAVATVVEGDFEWDDEKAQSNLDKHGVSFAEAATVFADPAAVYLHDVPGPTGWLLLEPRYATACSTLSMWSEADAIGLSARGPRLVPSETFTNPENTHDPVS